MTCLDTYWSKESSIIQRINDQTNMYIYVCVCVYRQTQSNQSVLIIQCSQANIICIYGGVKEFHKCTGLAYWTGFVPRTEVVCDFSSTF